MDIEALRLFPSGVVTAPPSKSVAHRALIAAALCQGAVVKNIQLSQDIQATLRCISALGGEYEYENGVYITKKAIGNAEGTVTADCGESGSTLRFFMPLAAAFGISVNFIGAKRLFERPLTPYY
ncbi:MAG: 3-phosphoshikimate 1-carboxyvinyltransferase, partial [Candidatus Avelusimicrobium sp.]